MNLCARATFLFIILYMLIFVVLQNLLETLKFVPKNPGLQMLWPINKFIIEQIEFMNSISLQIFAVQSFNRLFHAYLFH